LKMVLFLAERFAWRSHSKTLPDAPDEKVDASVEDALVAFLHAEADDPDKPKLESKIVKQLKWLANKRNLKTIALHSFTHLSASTAPPEYARELLNRLADRLTRNGYRVHQTPFGWFCSWDLAVYGESLAKVYAEF